MASKYIQPYIVILLLVLILVGSRGQNPYRPYRPISNIFGSLFRPGSGIPGPPPRQQHGSRNNHVQVSAGSSAASEGNNANENNNNQNNPTVTETSEADIAAQSGGPNLGQRSSSSSPTKGPSPNIPPPPPPPPPSVPQVSRNPPPRPDVPPPPPLPLPHRRHPPQRRPHPVPLRGPHPQGSPRILLRPQGPHGPLIGPLPKRPLPPLQQQQQQHHAPHSHEASNIPSIGQVLTLVTDDSSSTPPSTTASIHSASNSVSAGDELNAPSTDPSLTIVIDELNRAVPGLDIHNSLENTFLPPPTAASLVGSPPLLDPDSPESKTLAPSFKVHPRGYSGPVIISQVPVKSLQTSSQVLTEPMPDKHQHNHDNHHNHHDNHHDNHNNHDHHPHPRDLFTADSQLSEQLTPYPQPRFYDPVASRTLNSKRTRENSKRFSFEVNNNHHSSSSSDSHNHQSHNHNNHNHNNHNHESHRSNRLLHHGDNHNHHQHVQSEIIERMDEVIELVDCGGRDLGFCDMNSKYPGHMMGNLMSDCQELVYSGFVPVPDDIEELGDSNPVAKYSNSSKSAVRAQTGSWSWKPYTYESKQVCDSELRFIRPGYARDSTGKWQVVVQTEDLPQRVAIDLCHSPGKPCHLMSDCGRKSRCIQRYNFQHLLAIDPDNPHNCPTIRAFKFPSACVCHFEYPNHQKDFY